MIYLSAQPDEYYFLWQLKILLHNFNSLNIKRENIHVLIGFNPEIGLNLEYHEFISNCSGASFFTYPDTRRERKYKSSIRPHIIAKHFEKYQNLKYQTVFYHDSDIIFHSLPNFELLTMDNNWYASDARFYIGSKLLERMVGTDIFNNLCEIAGIKSIEALNNDENAGGAQYILKKVDHTFWRTIETTSERIFLTLEKYNISRTSGYPVQSWCADMWAIWWIAIQRGQPFKIHKELDFLWAYDNILKWGEKKILHYTGGSIDEEVLFSKSKYILYEPFYDDFKSIDQNSASLPIVNLLMHYRSLLDRARIRLDDVTFLILVRIDSVERLENLYIILNYLRKYFITNISVLEADDVSKIDKTRLPVSIEYEFVEDKADRIFRAKYYNYLTRKSNTPIISIYDVDVVIPINQITLAVEKISEGVCDVASPYNGSFISIDKLSKTVFSKLLDADFFEYNVGKYFAGTHRSYGGAIFLNRDKYINAGLENENINGWGPDDIERVKRLHILGYCIERIPGNLYHLPHPRLQNSGYQTIEERCEMMEEYLKICSYSDAELQIYVNTWPWK